MNNLVEQIFKDSAETNSFHDCVLDAGGASLDVRNLRRLFDSLPRNIQSIAYAWGLSDTVFRDEVSVFLKKSNLRLAKIYFEENEE